MNNMSQQMPMINVGGGLPPEILQQQQALNRQQQMAQLLMQQGQQMPSGQMVSGRYVAPSFFQYAAPLFQTYAGKSLAEKGDKAALDLATKLRETQSKEIEQFGELMKTDPAAAYRLAAQSYVPELRATGVKKMMPEDVTLGEGQKRFMVMPDGTTRVIAQGEEKYRAPISVDTGSRVELRDPRDPTKILQVIPKSINPADAIRMQFEGMNVGGMPNMGGQPNVGAQGGTAPQVKGVDEKFVPVVMPQYQYNPQLSPKQNQELSLKFNEKNLNNISNAKDSFDYLKQAAEILSTNKPSSGRLENIVTGTREFFGGGGEASKTDAQLNVLAGGLTMKQPRFEGPQGVLDVQLYQKLAGDVGNPNVPIASRLGAIEQMIGLQKKYYPNADWESIDISGPVVKKNVLGGTRGLGAKTMSPTEFKQNLAPQDLEAFNWATKNPNDPRSAQIKKRLGIE
jgi:hypothetical protein